MENKEYLDIADTLRSERARRGWTLKESSKKIGIGIVFLSEIERALKVPSALVIHDIAKAYDIEETAIALAYGKTPISVVETLQERKDFLDVIYEIKNTSKLSEDEKDEFFNHVVDMFKETLEKKEGG